MQYAISVLNQGPDVATNVRLDFTLDGFFITGISGACNTIPCSLGNISLNQTKSVTVTGFINTSGSGSFSISTQSDQNDRNMASNVANDNFNAQLAADVLTSLTPLTQAPYYQGQTVIYNLTIVNNGLTADYANDIALQLTADNLQIDSVLSDSCVGLPCSIPALGPSETEVIDVRATILNVGEFNLTAQAAAVQYDPFPDNNIDNTSNGGEAFLDPVENVFNDSFE
ncbi:MAG: hypothetical protein ACWA5R_11820 [bacterium]